MKKMICLLAAFGLFLSNQLLAFDENKFAELLKKFNKFAVPITPYMEKTDLMSGNKSGNSENTNDDFVWLKANEVNKQIEFIIQGIESAKNVATALAIIVNLYNSNRISAKVALIAIQMLKLRAIFLKIFITNGQSELEVMINILQEHEDEFSKKVQATTQMNAQINGRIKHAISK